MCLPACSGALFEAQSRGETGRRPTAGRPPPGGTPCRGGGTLRGEKSTRKYHLSFNWDRSNTDGFSIKEILCFSNQWILCMRVCVLLCVFSSYSLVQWAPTSAAISPLPLPPTASSAARLQSVDEKTTCVKTTLACTGSLPLQTVPYVLACALSAHSPSSVCLSVKYSLVLIYFLPTKVPEFM